MEFPNNLNYAIFRCKPIMTTQDLALIGLHNKREKKTYNSNPDIKIELSKNNIELVPLVEKYKKQHEERMKKFYIFFNCDNSVVVMEYGV